MPDRKSKEHSLIPDPGWLSEIVAGLLLALVAAMCVPGILGWLPPPKGCRTAHWIPGDLRRLGRRRDRNSSVLSKLGLNVPLDSTIHAIGQSSSWRSFLAFLATWREILYWIAVGENAVAQQVVDAAFRCIPVSVRDGWSRSTKRPWPKLEKRGLSVTRQQGIPVVYEEVRIHAGFFADLVVEDQVIVEIKAVETVTPVHKKQHHRFEAGGQASGTAPQLQRSPIKNGIARIVNGLKE